MLTEIQFQQSIDNLQYNIETAIDESNLDIDTDNVNGVLTITFNNNTSLILSRQLALKQLWIAAKSGGFHLNYNTEIKQWVLLSTEETIYQLLQRLINEQTDLLIHFK